MGIARSILYKYNDLTYLRQANTFQLISLTFTFICHVYHMIIYLEYQVLLILLFNLFFGAASTYNLVSSYKLPEVQTLVNHSHATCQLYWLCFVLLFCVYLIVLSYYRAFGSLANSSFITLFVLYILNLVLLVVSWTVLYDLRKVTFSDCSERDESNYLEQFDARLKNKVTRGDSEHQLVFVRKTSNCKNYEILTDVQSVKKDRTVVDPKIVRNGVNQKVATFPSRDSDTDYNTKSKQEMEYSSFFEPNPELGDPNQQ